MALGGWGVKIAPKGAFLYRLTITPKNVRICAYLISIYVSDTIHSKTSKKIPQKITPKIQNLTKEKYDTIFAT